MDSYQAQAFHPDLAKSPANGKLTIKGQQLVFIADEIEIKLPLNGLKLREGGADKLIFFSHSKLVRCEVCTQNRTILNNSLLLLDSKVAKQAAVIRKGRKTLWACLAVVIFLMLVMVWNVSVSITPFSEIVARNIPLEWEQELGKTSFEQIKQQNKILNHPEFNQKFQKFTDRLTKNIESPYSFHIVVVEDSKVNAFALPAGYIVMNSGLLKKAASGEEVLGVLAHEIAHVTRQHGIRNIIKSVGMYVVVQALLGDSIGLLAILADAAPMLLAQKYSRDFEREADQIGLDYLVAANINPQGMLSFFEKLEKLHQETENEQLKKVINLLSTHPATEERIENLNAEIEALEEQSYQSIQVEFENLKQSIGIK